MEGKDEVLGVLKFELTDLCQRIIDNHIRARQKASGKTIASLRVEITENSGILWGRKAFGTLETGRRSGRVPKRFYETIYDWIVAKGLIFKNPKSVAYLTARKIAREGTQLYRDGGRDDIYSKEIERTIQAVMEKVFGIFERDIEHINLNSNENRGV
ncbi:hypothetical protein [Bacteroides sp. BFG-606]|uniref:hypothetical protein n=1 Tax=Bacteroides sp. BFG-606 TaxID=2972763 RepID=UPI00216550CD|nr:hypothetical protein [Bacteroides sp. BFG-606]MCS2335465.1 hypothetical protein [Bacteroides sp. BFG-606]